MIAMPSARPTYEWLERAIATWIGCSTPHSIARAWEPGHTESLAHHILGNWLMIQEVIPFHPDSETVGTYQAVDIDSCRAKECAELDRAIAQFEELVSA